MSEAQKVMVTGEVVEVYHDDSAHVRLDSGFGAPLIFVAADKIVKFSRLRCEHPCAECKKQNHKRQTRRKA